MRTSNKLPPNEYLNYIPIKLYGGKVNILMVSSIFLLIPGIYGFLIDQFYHGLYSSVAAFVSFYYWRTPDDKRTKKIQFIDRAVSRSLFVFYFVTGSYCAESWSQTQVLLAYPLTFGMIGGYLMAGYTNDFWWSIFHFSFHLFAVGVIKVCLLSTNSLISFFYNVSLFYLPFLFLPFFSLFLDNCSAQRAHSNKHLCEVHSLGFLILIPRRILKYSIT